MSYSDKPSNDDVIEMYHELLEELDLPESFDKVRIWKELDPIAYRIGFNEYVDSLVDDGVLDEDDADEYEID